MSCQDLPSCIIAITMLALIWSISSLLLYATYQYYKYRNHQHIQPRYPIFVTILSLFSIFVLFTKDTLIFVRFGICYDLALNNTNLHVLTSIFEPLSIGVCLGMLIRVWLINYDIHYTVWQSKHSWQSLLLEEIKMNDNWYALNKHQYGNWKYMFSYMSIIFIILTTTSFLISVFALNDDPGNHEYLYSSLLTLSCVYVITFINFGVILCKMPSFNDQFFIRKEITLIVVINIICIAIYFIMAVITYPTRAIHDNLAIVLNNTCLTVYNLSIPLISTVWVIREFKRNDVIIMDEMPLHRLSSNASYDKFAFKTNLRLTVSTTRPNSKTVQNGYISPNKLFRVILNNDLALSQFMVHLQKFGKISVSVSIITPMFIMCTSTFITFTLLQISYTHTHPKNAIATVNSQ